MSHLQAPPQVHHATFQDPKERARFRERLLDSVGDAIIATDLRGTILYWSRGATRLFGWERDEALGRPITEITPAPGWEDRATELMDSLVRGESWSGEFRLRRKDGSSFPGLVTDTPLHDASGELIGVVGVTADLTELKAAERSARASQERFRALIENSSDMIAVMAPDGEVLYESPSTAGLTGRDPADRAGQNPFDDGTIHPEDLETAREVMAEVLDHPRKPRPFTVRIRHEDGEYRVLEGTVTNLVDVEAIRGLVVNGRDITERLHLERRLARAERLEAVGSLAGGIAHDFNNLLTGIHGFTRMVLEDLETDSPHRGDLEEVLRTADRATDLTRQLLAFSRNQVLQPQVVNLGGAVSEMERMLQPLIGEDIRLTVDLPDDEVRVEVDPTQLEQVIMNLCLNARDAMPGGGSLDIRIHSVERRGSEAGDSELEPGPYAALVVKDTGTGMTDRVMDHIFEPFFSTKDPGESTGLGLATVFGIVKQSRGHISVTSEVGGGTCFTILLPRTREEPAAADPEEPRQLPGEAAEQRILVVEDDHGVRSLLERLLVRTGYEVTTAPSGPEAEKIVARGKSAFHLLLTDLVMPGMDGMELARRLRGQDPELKVLFMTGYTEDEIARRGLAESPDRFLTKPFSFEEVVEKVHRTLAGSGAPT